MELAMGNSKKTFINIFALLLLITVSCNSQNSKNENKIIDIQIITEKEMEQDKRKTHNVFENYNPIKQFNIKGFNAKNKRGEYNFVDDGMEVLQMKNVEYPSGKVNGYYEYRKYPNSAYEFFSEYDVNGFLLHTIVTFHSIEFGIVKHYDSSGNIVKEENLDIPYKFSIDDLIDKMKAEYDVNITDSRICVSVDRGIEEKYNSNPLYDVYINADPTGRQQICYVIDGLTGETLFTTTRYRGEKRGSLTDEYFNSLK